MSLAKKSKVNLPKDWIVVNSTSFPDRVYFFNVRSGKSSWKYPRDETIKPKPGKASQKRKLSVENEKDEIPPRNMRSPSSTGTEKGTTRRMLRAKRPSEPPKTKETPQMKEMRQKILEKKQSKLPPKVTARPGGSMPEINDDKAQKLTKSGKLIAQKRFPKAQSRVDTSKQVTKISARSTSSAEESGERRSIASSSATSSQTSMSTMVSNVTRTSRISGARSEKNFDSSKSVHTPQNSTLKKNLANKRLDSLKKTLTNESKRIEPAITAKVARRMLLQNFEQKKCDTVSLSNLENGSEDATSLIEVSPNISQNAESRLKSLRARLSTNSTLSVARVTQDCNKLDEAATRAPKVAKTIKKPVKRGRKAVPAVAQNVTADRDEAGTSKEYLVTENQPRDDSFWEEMEWEPIEEEKVVIEIQEVRTQLSTDQSLQQKVPDCAISGLELSQVSQNTDKRMLYIVIDTNVYLSNLKTVTELLEESGKINGHYKPVVVVPWTVLQELDYIKDNKSRTKSAHLQRSAKTAVDMLFRYFSSKHPRLKGQTAEDAASNRMKYQVESPDDEILQSCLQIRELGYTVVLLSNDKNLCNKAMVNNIQTYGRHDSIQEMLSLNEKELELRPSKKESLVFPKNPGAEIVDSKEVEISDDIFCEAKAIIKNFLSTIVSKEMENLYGENWKKYTIVQPPWSVTDVLKCTSKHWIAAISDVFLKQAESLVSKLSNMFLNAPKYGQSLRYVRDVLEACSDLAQMMKSKDYQKLSEETCSAIKELMDNSKEKLKELEGNRSESLVGQVENNNLNDEQRADNAFKYFEQIWTFTNNFCGLTADMTGIPHSITYKISDQVLPLETINRMQPELVNSLNRLIDALRKVLNDDEYLTADHPALATLYHIMINYYPSSDMLNGLKCLDIVDLLCCIKVKKEFLKTGLVQLQELSYQFCRIADFRFSSTNIAIN